MRKRPAKNKCSLRLCHGCLCWNKRLFVFLEHQSGLSSRIVQQSFFLHQPSHSISLWLLVLPCHVVQWHFLLMIPFWYGDYGAVFTACGLSYAPLSHTWDVHTLISVSTLWILQSEYLPRGVRKKHTFKINVNKTDPLISWLALIATQTTWILSHFSSLILSDFWFLLSNDWKPVLNVKFADYRLFLFTNGSERNVISWSQFLWLFSCSMLEVASISNFSVL